MTANASMEKQRQPELLCRNSVLPTGLFNHPKLQNSDKSRRVLKKTKKIGGACGSVGVTFGRESCVGLSRGLQS